MLVNGLLLAASFGSLASAATQKVAVGSGGLKYAPSSLTAAVGDTIEFDFSGVMHDVVQSTFESPCSPSSGGFFVSPQSSSGVTFTITVNDTNPIYFYCSVASHCQSGMVGVINPV
jgi:plastocyanin